MKTSHVICTALVCLLGITRAASAGQAATVTQVSHVVKYGPHESSHLSPAVENMLLPDGDLISTGGKPSLAELQLPTQSITRLGANTTFNYSAESNIVELQSGTILFCKPKDAKLLQIKTAAVMAGIVGTTGFFSIGRDEKTHERTYLFGIVEGHAKATANGQEFKVGPGDILFFKLKSKPFLFSFDIPRFVKSSPLINKFKRRLPNQGYIDAEIAKYADLVHRGFIQPPSTSIEYGDEIPLPSAPAYDSAQNALGGGQPKGTPAPPLGTGH